MYLTSLIDAAVIALHPALLYSLLYICNEMTLHSYFQTLPEHIINTIVKYVVTTHEHALRRQRDFGLALLHSCHRWRIAFARETLSDAVVDTCIDEDPELTYKKWPPKLNLPGFPTDNFVKNVSFSYESWYRPESRESLIVDHNLSMFNFFFPAAYSLDLHISINSHYDTSESLEWLEYVILCLMDSVPNYKRIDIRYQYIIGADVDYDVNKFVAQVTTSFANKAQQISVSGIDIFREKYLVDPSEFKLLTRLKFDCNDGLFWSNVAVCNSATLQKLHASKIYQDDFNAILYDELDNPVQYPCLEVLHIYVIGEYDNADYCGGNSHFPGLKRLAINCFYPTCDNIFFGSKGTLQSLHLNVFSGLYTLAKNQQIFEPETLKKLSSATFVIDRDVIRNDQLADGFDNGDLCCVKEILKNSTCLERLSISSTIASSMFISIVESLPNLFARIQFISIPRVRLSFTDIVLLLQKAPQLHTVKLSLDQEFPCIDNMGFEDTVSHIKCNFNPINKFFRRIEFLDIMNNQHHHYSNMVTCYLAVGCPRLTFAKVWGFSCLAVRNGLEKLLNSEVLNESTEQINFIMLYLEYNI